MKNYWLLIFTFALFACEEKDNTPEPDPDLVYFLVTENDVVHGDSYILPLKDPVVIAQARQLIENQEKKIIIAEISNDKHDHYSVNKDLIGNRVWSWHVTSFLEFADLGIEILDGWPLYVEQNYDEWVNNTKSSNGKGRIGFWNYSISGEVEKSELH